MPEAVLRTAAESEVLELHGARILLALTAADTGGAYSLIDYTAPPGYGGPPPHWHRRGGELLYLVSGRLRVEVDGQEHDLWPSDAVHVPAGVVHRFSNPFESHARFLAQTWPGGIEEYFRGLVRIAHASPDWPPSDHAELDALAWAHDIHPPPALP
ncbi:MAG TPA: cupin domain-containing protein [Gemmatimonadales bacterium]|nr:cupin domain-containing protein [Gemmatimonadales bacterium]